jgi:hypothetical protein
LWSLPFADRKQMTNQTCWKKNIRYRYTPGNRLKVSVIATLNPEPCAPSSWWKITISNKQKIKKISSMPLCQNSKKKTVCRHPYSINRTGLQIRLHFTRVRHLQKNLVSENNSEFQNPEYCKKC